MNSVAIQKNTATNFNINRYFLAPILLHSDSSTITITQADASKPSRMKYRSVPDRKELGIRLTTWRQLVHSSSPILQQWPVEWILDDNNIVLLARAKPGHFSVSLDVTEFLGESEEWGQLRAPEVFLTIRNYDLQLNAERALAAAKKKEENKRRAADKRKERWQARQQHSGRWSRMVLSPKSKMMAVTMV
jgi:hypothetical protein